MKKICVSLTFLSVCFCIFFFGLHANMYASDVDSPSSDDPETTPQRLPEKMVYELLKEQKITKIYDAYPRELYFGDTLYIADYIKVISEEAVMMQDVFYNSHYRHARIRITSDELNRSYEHQLATPIAGGHDPNVWNSADDCFNLEFSERQPREKIYCDAYYAEICPLQEYDLPFWKELRTKMTSEGIVCHVGFYNVREEITDENKPAFGFDILIKPRPESEMELLRTWYESTPREQFSHLWEGQTGGRNKIRLSKFSLKTYEPGLFIRAGYLKPGIPNNPRTLDGWRKLELSIIPSTMRDEITMIRFNLELFAARGNYADRKRIRNKYAEWLNSLPEVQRTVMLLEYEYRYPGKDPSGKKLLSVDRDTLSVSDFMVPIEK